MDYKISIVRYLYYFSLIGLLILYLFPGSLIGYFLYGDFNLQPNMLSNSIGTSIPDIIPPNPMGTSINHALAFFYLSIIGLISYMRGSAFKKTLIFLITLSLISELSHLIIPNRSFQSLDLFANILGTLLAIVIIFFYKRLKNGKI
tara:strand:- start:728 stop:1165 length:438 start_codon:yes stop_codon:yes gene_type:complete